MSSTLLAGQDQKLVHVPRPQNSSPVLLLQMFHACCLTSKGCKSEDAVILLSKLRHMSHKCVACLDVTDDRLLAHSLVSLAFENSGLESRRGPDCKT